MSRRPPRDVAASIRQRLYELARRRTEEFQLVLTHYVLERLLYRLARSPHRDRFVLKGAILFHAWGGEAHRPTRDLDLLVTRPTGIPDLERIFRELCVVSVEKDDGIQLDPGTVRGTRIQDDVYAPVRMTLTARLARARITVQVDVGVGDPVTPGPEEVDFPTLLPDLPAPRLRAYPRETVVAEKFEAIVALGIANSRMKDFYDAWVLSRRFPFDGETLCRAITATFGRRRTAIPGDLPLALTDAFANDAAKRAQWRAFRSRGRLGDDGKSLVEVVGDLRDFLTPPATAAVSRKPFDMIWPPGGPWQATDSTRRRSRLTGAGRGR